MIKEDSSKEAAFEQRVEIREAASHGASTLEVKEIETAETSMATKLVIPRSASRPVWRGK